MLRQLLPSFLDELEKLSMAEKPELPKTVKQRFAITSWGDFEEALKSRPFQRRVLDSTNDPKLQEYVRSMSLFHNSSQVKAKVRSFANPAKEFEVKKLRDGRFGCSCNDWRYVRSVNGTDCKHIKKYKDHLKGLVKESAMSYPSIQAFSDELQKIAARRGLKEIRKAVQGGDVARASRLAKSPGVLKATDAGSQIRDIGHGGEGLATMVAHPQHGVAVRKLYNPQAVTPELIARKEQAAQLTKNNPNVARMLGSHSTPSGGKMHMMEYVHGKPVQQTPQNYQAIQNTRKSLQTDLKRGGMVAQDVRSANMIQTPSGKTKLVDYIPGKVGDFESGNTRTRVNQQLKAQGQQQMGKGHILATQQAPEMLKGVSSDMSSSGALKGNAFRGSALGFQMPRGNTAATAISPKPVAASPVAAPVKPVAAAPSGNPTRPIKMPVR